jgi:hypothetical protein
MYPTTDSWYTWRDDAVAVSLPIRLPNTKPDPDALLRRSVKQYVATDRLSKVLVTANSTRTVSGCLSVWRKACNWSEPLLSHDNTDYVLFPIKPEDEEAWVFYKKAEASFWTTEEVDLANDRKDFDTLSENERFFILHVLAFFAASDGIVNENGFQIMMENIHAETYSVLIDTYANSEEQRNYLCGTPDRIRRGGGHLLLGVLLLHLLDEETGPGFRGVATQSFEASALGRPDSRARVRGGSLRTTLCDGSPAGGTHRYE